MESLRARSASFLDVDAALRSVELASWLHRTDEIFETDVETEEELGSFSPDDFCPYGLPSTRLNTRMVSVGQWLQAPGRSEGEVAFKARIRDLLGG